MTLRHHKLVLTLLIGTFVGVFSGVLLAYQAYQQGPKADTLSPASFSSGTFECNNGLDDDNDTKIDHGTNSWNDPGCDGPEDNSENSDDPVFGSTQCSDTKDNDGDQKVDGSDPGCYNNGVYTWHDNDERNDATPPDPRTCPTTAVYNQSFSIEANDASFEVRNANGTLKSYAITFNARRSYLAFASVGQGFRIAGVMKFRIFFKTSPKGARLASRTVNIPIRGELAKGMALDIVRGVLQLKVTDDGSLILFNPSKGQTLLTLFSGPLCQPAVEIGQRRLIMTVTPPEIIDHTLFKELRKGSLDAIISFLLQSQVSFGWGDPLPPPRKRP